MARKFLLNNGYFKLSASVEFHLELAKDHSTTKGGGWWHMDEEKKILYLFGLSTDFGPAEPEDIKTHMDNTTMLRFEGFEVLYSREPSNTLPPLHTFTHLCKIE
jgi:hypothetical protein